MAEETIPGTLEEAVLALEDIILPEDKAILEAGQYQAVVLLHDDLGRFLRNKWGLWADSVLAQHLRTKHEVSHPDEMSTFVLMEFCRRNHPTTWDILNREED